MRAAAAIGWSGVVVNFRGCSGESNRLPRAYHSGDSDEIDWILRRLQRFPAPPALRRRRLAGWQCAAQMARRTRKARRDCLRAAAAVSAPLDLTACGHHLARGFNRVYTRHFLHTLKRNAAASCAATPASSTNGACAAASNLYEFDDVVTAPLHGFAGADDYWRRASSKPWLPASACRRCCSTPATILSCQRRRCLLPARSGHVGFVTGSLPGQLDWLPQRIFIISSTRFDMNAPLPATIFKAYDIRGIVGTDADRPISSAASATASGRWRLSVASARSQ
jgi:predicted alpha/beta-fold hydrolase